MNAVSCRLQSSSARLRTSPENRWYRMKGGFPAGNSNRSLVARPKQKNRPRESVTQEFSGEGNLRQPDHVRRRRNSNRTRGIAHLHKMDREGDPRRYEQPIERETPRPCRGCSRILIAFVARCSSFSFFEQDHAHKSSGTKASRQRQRFHSTFFPKLHRRQRGFGQYSFR